MTINGTTELDVLFYPINGIQLIEASAGTGKTWNICALYLRLLVEEVLPVEKILVVTFTNAATAELRERIRSQIIQALLWLEKKNKKESTQDLFFYELFKAVNINTANQRTEEEIRGLLNTARHSFDQAAIYTIHSFCQRALSDTPFSAAIPFHFENTQNDHEMRLSVVQDFWRHHVIEGELSPELAQYLIDRMDSPDIWTKLLLRNSQRLCPNLIWPERKSGASDVEMERFALLKTLFRETNKVLSAEKQKRRIISSDDLLLNIYHILASDNEFWLATSLRNRYPVALIDEFQDTDSIQFHIFDMIYRVNPNKPGTLFLVGDPKQAIYRFRNADLYTYLQARELASQRYTLNTNQRSVWPLINSVNQLFSVHANAFVIPDLAYRPMEMGRKPRAVLVDKTEFPSNAMRIWTLPTRQGKYLFRSEAMALAAQATAAEIARLICAGQSGQITLTEKQLMPGQIAVLVPNHRQGQQVKAALAHLQISSVELSQENIFNTQDARDLEKIVLAILRPNRTTALYAALSTDTMGYDATALSALRENETALLATMSRFEIYHQTWLHRGFGFMFRRWLDQEQITKRLLAREDGERRLTNLLHLAELIQQASAEHPAPDDMVRWLSERKSEKGDEVTQLRLESDRNLVKIVTIHKAKGLEYDIVFCPFLWDGYKNSKKNLEGVEYHTKDNGWVIDFRPEATGKSKEANRIRSLRRSESDAEWVRLAYVALTRAVQRCYLIAGSYLKPSSGKLSFAESSRSPLNWLVAGSSKTYSEWLKNKLTPEEISAAWKNIAKKIPEALFEELPNNPGTPISIQNPAPESLSTLKTPAHLPQGWRMGSFSSLQHGSARPNTELAVRDHDGRSKKMNRFPSNEITPDDFLRFPKGAAAGECVHAVFENIDFTAPNTWASVIDLALINHPQILPQSNTLESHVHLKSMLEQLLDSVMNATLPDDILLGKIPQSDKQVELGFSFSATHVDSNTLNDWLQKNQYPMPSMNFPRLQGYLKGYIDLVFRHNGKFYVLDWKSNHLGYTAEDYEQQSLAQAMEEHGYHLQYLLYSVAVQRYLAFRLQNYDFDQHFGGVLYLFVRGIRPTWNGVYFHRPSREILASLDRLLSGTQP